ncbi:MAG: hypothetical protein HDKAJFGB_03843 [Anaerolineae bacterium]|nr:hypothetical protein [Anaerolineae bacterium]
MHIEQPERGDDNDCAENDRGQKREQRREKEQKDDGERRGAQSDQLGFTAHLVVNDRARATGCRRKTRQQTRADIRHTNRDEFLVGVDLLAVFCRKDARSQNFIRVNQDCQGERNR